MKKDWASSAVASAAYTVPRRRDRRGSGSGPGRDRPGARVRRGALRSRHPRRGEGRPGPGLAARTADPVAARAALADAKAAADLAYERSVARGAEDLGRRMEESRQRLLAQEADQWLPEEYDECGGRHRRVGGPLRPGRLRGRPCTGLPGAEGHGRPVDPARRAPALGEDAARRHRAAHGRGRGDGRVRRGAGPEGQRSPPSTRRASRTGRRTGSTTPRRASARPARRRRTRCASRAKRARAGTRSRRSRPRN